MPITDGPGFRLAAALAIGLMIGAERERRKGTGPLRSPAGIRTFALASLSGGISFLIGSTPLLAVAVVAMGILCAAAYVRSSDQDPGLTTEIALVLTVLLGGLAQQYVAIASAIAVIITILLGVRTRIHRFVSSVLTEEELTDAIIFAAAILVVLPFMPNRYLGPYAAINLRIIWRIVILIMTISAAGHIAVRLFGPRFGLPMAGLASGFVSSTATIAAMGQRAAQEPTVARPAVAGAVLSTVATILQLAVVLAATSTATLYTLRIPLISAGAAALVYGVVLTLISVRRSVPNTRETGRAFSLPASLLLAGGIAAVLFVSAALNRWLGEPGVLAAAAVAGFADTHSPAASVASLVAANKLNPADSVIPILAGLTTNTISKIVMAVWSGGWRFAVLVAPGLVLVMVAAWSGVAITPPR